MPKGGKGKAKAAGNAAEKPRRARNPRTGATTQAPDPANAMAARKAAFGAFRLGFGAGNMGGLGQINTSAYTSAYSGMGVGTGMVNDVPQYFQIMNENNGGILYWPVTLKEKYSWFRYFANCFADSSVPVLTADGRVRPMRELTEGDLVTNALGESVPVKGLASFDYEGLLYSIRAEGLPTLEVTGDHLFRVREADAKADSLVWKPARLLESGDSLVAPASNGKTSPQQFPICEIKTRPYSGKVHSLELGADEYDARSYIAGGVVSHNCDPFVSRAVQFHSDLPMSRLILRMPKMKDETLRRRILAKYEGMVKRLKLFERLHSVLYELNTLGNCFAYADFDEERKEWGRLVILPPEEIVISRYPMSDIARVQYRPELLSGLLRNYSIPTESEEAYRAFVKGLPESDRGVFADISYEVAKALIQNDGVLDLDTDPFTGEDGHKVGSFVYHFSLQRHEYFDLGVSPLESVLIPLLMKEHYKYTQLSLASRNMTPRMKVNAPNTTEAELADLREQLDMSMLNPDYAIVTNYDWSWEQLGAENRLIDLSREYESIESQLFAGLGVTREILTGEGMYSGSKISVELLNTRYLFMRDLLTHYVEESLFQPIAEECGFYAIDEWGNKEYYYPRLSFTRLSIRDNNEVFDSLFQLYQKGSLPIDVILELFNLDSDEIHDKLRQDMFTVKDSTYNDMIRSVYNDVSSKVAEETDLADQMIAYLRGPDGKPLKKKPPEGEEGGGMGAPEAPYGDASGFGGDGGETPPTGPETGDTGAPEDVGDYLDRLISDAAENPQQGEAVVQGAETPAAAAPESRLSAPTPPAVAFSANSVDDLVTEEDGNGVG